MKPVKVVCEEYEGDAVFFLTFPPSYFRRIILCEDVSI